MKYYGLSDIGLVREMNQDSFFYDVNKNDEFLAIVCDGIGGGKAGDIASKIAVDVISSSFMNRDLIISDKQNQDWILKVVEDANNAIYENSLTSRSRHGMGTTLVGILKTHDNTYVFHLGDSRLYGVYEDEFICLTEDHNLAADLIKSGEMKEEEALAHPRAKALTNALGIWSKYHVDINKIKGGYTSLMLCSDGLYGYVSENTILHVLNQKDETKNKVKRLIELGNQNGGFDNITVIILEEDGGLQHE